MPYKKIVVPLDGSKLAESVLSHVEDIAKGCSVPEVVLVTVTERLKGTTPRAEYVEQITAHQAQSNVVFMDRLHTHRVFTVPPSLAIPVIVGKMAKSGYEYLKGIAVKLEKKGIQTSIAVLMGKVAEEIIVYAAEEKADLIIMASSGRMKGKRWDVANAAPKVFRDSNIPILLVKPPADFKETKPRRKGKS
jgi:nucleotide-binding universal stress UspA family protein